MFRISSRSEVKPAPPPPAGVTEIIFCVFDEKNHVRHHFQAICPVDEEEDHFLLLNVPESAFDSCVLSEAVATRQPASIALSYGEGRRKYLNVLPYERKRGKWRYACLQISTEAPDPDSAITAWVRALAEERVCFLLVDAHNTIQSASAEVPEAFGHTSETLMGLNLSDLFSGLDLSMMDSCALDMNEPIPGFVLRCLDGSHRDVELLKYSAADHCMLYAVCDVTRPQLNEEIAQVSTRERRRIGQDLHDSIGQLLTGISLLSRSLAYFFIIYCNLGEEDAAQISELADDASNQIRQISRGLMPADIVERG
ncbi:MAG: hypothetical protein HKP10_02120, partial [Kiritimatiellales bacterium]|nr:hypothetical protein [Kiritimatiellales bacterium]